MRIFFAGATGVLGRRVVPLLTGAGHEVTGMTRTPHNLRLLSDHGANGVVCDAFDGDALTAAITRARPDLVIHELTDLPDDPARVAEHFDANARIRVEGTRNLLDAARAAGCTRVLAQSVAWPMPAEIGGEAVAFLERSVLDADGVVLRYGQFYGPGTFHPDTLPNVPRVHVDTAARKTVDALNAASGIIEITD